ncbi:MAG TPA: hypothetical protein PK867_14475 [Pirellulales bacterium]|nr:hypothetical protein [Pirellulales bacterium]
MARSVRPAQRSPESSAASLLTESVIVVDIHYHAPPELRVVLAETLAVELPRFDALRGELWFLGVLIKRLKGPAENQRTFLRCYQDQNWQRLLFDPLAPNGITDPHMRFFDTVESLNSCHANPGWIEFVPEGGEKVCWTEGPKATAQPALRRPPPTARLAVCGASTD